MGEDVISEHIHKAARYQTALHLSAELNTGGGIRTLDLRPRHEFYNDK